jgi:hypothetical protein
MSLVRAQVRLQGKTGTPEDVITNTFHFSSGAGDAIPLVYDTIHIALGVFYGVVDQYLSDMVFAAAEVRYYDMTDAEPRVPYIKPLTLTLPVNPPLPAEVAICLSYNAGAPITPRRRGRIFLGPLGTNVLAAGAGTDARVSTTVQTNIANAAANLAALGTLYPWVIYSPTSGAFDEVTQGYVDNAFDIQRRRGFKTTARTAWTATT